MLQTAVGLGCSVSQVSSFGVSHHCYMRIVERIEQVVRFDVGQLRQPLHSVEVLLCLWKLSFDVC